MSKILEMIDDVLTSVAREQYPADTEYWKTKNMQEDLKTWWDDTLYTKLIKEYAKK